MQGCGVSTPRAAAVAAATWGFVGLLHRPNGLMFAIGAKSMIVAAEALVPRAGLVGDADKDDGAAPTLQVRTAPSTSWTAMGDTFGGIGRGARNQRFCRHFGREFLPYRTLSRLQHRFESGGARK
jgi:hypothetical protein